MTTARWDTTHGEAAQELLLLHPDSPDAYRCRVAVTRRGLLLRRLPDRPGRRLRKGNALRVPWWSVRGFSADDTETAPDGTVLQVVQVVTDAGALSLMAPASDVSVLLGRIRRRSGSWSRLRRPVAAAAARELAIAGGVLRPVGAPFRAVGAACLWVASGLGRAVAAAARVLTAPFLVLLRPVFHLVAWATAPLRRRLASSALGLAVAAAWRRLAGGDRARRLFRPVLAGSVSLLLIGGAVLAVVGGSAPASSAAGSGGRLALSQERVDDPSMARMAEGLDWKQASKPIDLPKATAPPAPAPPSLADEPPLSPHEVFGFAPYWTLTQSTGFDVGGLTTIAYFSIGVNADGTLDESGSGWDGYESQDLANLVTRAHAAGVRVVLTVNCFDQTSLNELTSSATAPTTLSAALIQAIEAKNLDGVNIDFEGEGSADQAGLTDLITKVSGAIHAVNPNYQVSMDTYASSAGDPNGFYDIPALAPAVNAFFVMAYQLNLQGSPTAASPLTSSMFSDLTTAEQYAAAVPANKVIMGVPYYGYTWPTTNGTMAAQAAGGATPVTYAQVMASGHPVYWDAVTDTAWTSYQVGNQWYEEYFEDPSSLYMIAQMAQSYGLGGLGIWALGMDGNDPQMLAALDGFAPASRDGLAGPTATAPPSSTTTSTPASASSPASALASSPASTSTSVPSSTTSPSPTTTSPSGSGSTTTSPSGTSTTTSPTAGTSGATSLRYSGIWDGQTVPLTHVAASKVTTSGTPVFLGQLTGFQTNDPALACLESASSLDVWEFGPTPTQYVVVAVQPTDCATADFTFPVPASTTGDGTGSDGSVTSAVSGSSSEPSSTSTDRSSVSAGTTTTTTTTP